MAIRDINKKPHIIDRDNNIFIGIDLPFRKSDGAEGWFASTKTTLFAIKNNIHALLLTTKGERLMQPNLGLNLRKYLFEPFGANTRIAIENDIMDAFAFWLPFVNIKELEVNMTDKDKNEINISITFNIKRDPRSFESIQVTIGE